MTHNRLYRKYETPDGPPVEIAINRRGCKGPWTAQDEEAIKALALAAAKQFGGGSVASSVPEPRYPQEDPRPRSSGGDSMSEHEAGRQLDRWPWLALFVWWAMIISAMLTVVEYSRSNESQTYQRQRDSLERTR